MDAAAARKYPRTLHLPFSPGTTSDDRIARDVSVLTDGAPVIVTEKLDGENTCLNRFGVFARSHAAPTRNPWASYLWDIWRTRKNDLGDLEVFGESLYAVHSITYSALTDYFYVFAVRDGERWLAWDEVVLYARLLDLPTVPELFAGPIRPDELEPLVSRLVAEPSRLSNPELGPAECEGVVVRVARAFEDGEFGRVVFKYVRKGHVTTSQHWTRNWQRAKRAWEWHSAAQPLAEQAK